MPYSRPSPVRRASAFGCLAVALVFPVVAIAQPAAPSADDRPDSLFSTDYLKSLVADTGSVLSEPARWDESQWSSAGIWTGATLLAAGFDHQVRKEVQTHDRSRHADRFFQQWERLGAEYSFVEIGAFEVWGIAADNRNARDTAMDAVTSTVIASGIITPVLKYSFGRYRPSQTTSTFKFSPFSGHQSFPSGHATQAFAVATVVAAHYSEPWEQALSYGAATLVDFARIQQNAHFASDVVAGSAIGWAVGEAVVHRHGVAGGFTMAPWIGRETGLVLTKDF